jgi:DNA-binding XRE family transcriptional regulator
MHREITSMHDMASLVRGRRTDLELSQDELAKRAGLARKTVIELERGSSTPSIESVLRLVGAFGLRLVVTDEGERGGRVDLDALIGGHSS